MNFLLDIVSSGNKADFEVSIWDNMRNMLENDPGTFFLDLIGFIFSAIGILTLLFLPAIILYIIYKKQRKKEELEEKEQN